MILRWHSSALIALTDSTLRKYQMNNRTIRLLRVLVCFLEAFCTQTIPGSGLEHHNLDSVSARLHIILSYVNL